MFLHKNQKEWYTAAKYKRRVKACSAVTPNASARPLSNSYLGIGLYRVTGTS